MCDGATVASGAAATVVKGVAEVSFGIGPHCHVLELPGENALCNCRIIIDQVVLCRNIASVAEHHYFGLVLRGDISSGIVEHHHRLGPLEHSFWGHCTIIVWIARRTPESI